MRDADYLVVELREKRPDAPDPRLSNIEHDANDTPATCDVCGYWGLTKANASEVREIAAKPVREAILCCTDCDEEMTDSSESQ